MNDEAARAALMARQGAGARYDAASAPADGLLLARRGTAYFARLLNDLGDEALNGSSSDGRTRRHVVAEVSYQARALCRAIAAAKAGTEEPMFPSEAARLAEIDMGASLPARALRSLFSHTEVHLNVEWRDLSDADWALTGPMPLRDTPLLRAKVIWQGALALNAGGRLADLPPEFGI